MFKSKATFMEKPGAWATILLFSVFLGLSLAGKIVFGYTVSETLMAYPLELISPLGLMMAIGSALCLHSYYLGTHDDFDRLPLDRFGTILFTGSWIVLTLVTSVRWPDSLFFCLLALCMATCGLGHLRYLRVERKKATRVCLEEKS